EGASSLRAALAALEHSAVQVRGITLDLADLAEAVESRGQPEPELLVPLEVPRPHRDGLAELMLVDARSDLELWHIQGGLLANVDRLLREIDLERGPDARRVRRRRTATTRGRPPTGRGP